MTIPTELLELLALYPPGRVLFDAEARVVGYENTTPHLIDAPPEPGMTRITNDVTFYGSDAETNMRSALSACKALIAAGFSVSARAAKLVNRGGMLLITEAEWCGTYVNVWLWHEVETPIDDREIDGRDEIRALVKQWGGVLGDNFGLGKGPPAIAEVSPAPAVRIPF
jgi:hypothetical protein